MDFITKLPKLGKYDTILMITDHDCSKAAIFIPCQETITAEGVVALYVWHVYPRYGIPAKVITDRDTRFMSKFAKGLCKALQIKQNISTVYHPQNAQISSWRHISGSIVKRNKTIGINGYHSQNSRIIRCQMRPQGRLHST